MSWKLRVAISGVSLDIAFIEKDAQCFMIEFLNETSQTHIEDFARFIRTLELIAKGGVLRNKDVYKPLRPELQLNEIKVGVLRAICFEHKSGGELICTNGFVKSSEKTPIKEIKKANWLKSGLLLAEQKSAIERIT